MTRSATANAPVPASRPHFKWFSPPPEDEGWGAWRSVVHADRLEPGTLGGDRKESALECAAWLPPETAGARPLVIALQGCGQSPSEIDDELGWARLARARRFAVMFVRETGGDCAAPSWWGPIIDRGCFDWFDVDGAKRNKGQPAGIVEALDRLLNERPGAVDPRRVYVVGFSAGAGMAALLLTAWPDRFAGAGVVAGPAVGAAESVGGGWSIYVAPQMFHWPDAMRGWASSLRAAACATRGVRPEGYAHKVSIWHGEVDPVVNRGHGVALADQFAGMMNVPVTRQWSWFLPRVDVSGQTASHARRTLVDPIGGVRRTLNRTVFTDPRTGEEVIQTNWIDYLGHAAPVAPSLDADGEVIGENDRRKYVGVDSTAEMLDFFGVGPG